jgi:hypothetical protein
MKTTKLTWRELRELNPAAFQAHMESVLDYTEETDNLKIEQREDGKLFIDGCYPGDEYGGGIRTEWTGEYFEEVSFEDEDEEQDDDEQG